ncbi:kinase-like protein [Trametes sanguinea]|nr:kinase-like protein [Trametes sanguinea]
MQFVRSPPIPLHFDIMFPAEDYENYKPGGYHPVIIGDTFDKDMSLPVHHRRYRVVHKLGYGSYGTAWLANDSHARCVSTALDASESNAACAREAHFLRSFAAAQHRTSPTFVVELYEDFQIQGPNGRHQIIVTEVVVPVRDILNLSPTVNLKWRKAAAKSLILGVADVHRAGVKHGDLHIRNMGVAFPELACEDEGDVLQELSPYDITMVLPVDPAQQTASLPRFMLNHCDLGPLWRNICKTASGPDVKIFDFGSARNVNEPAGPVQCAAGACAPEVAFAHIALKQPTVEWGPPADIWALGLTIFEILTGSSLQSSWWGLVGWTLHTMVLLAGSVPHRWETVWQSRYRDVKDTSPEAVAKHWDWMRQCLCARLEDDAEADRVVAFLRWIFVIEPTERPTIRDVLNHAWVAGLFDA